MGNKGKQKDFTAFQSLTWIYNDLPDIPGFLHPPKDWKGKVAFPHPFSSSSGSWSLNNRKRGPYRNLTEK